MTTTPLVVRMALAEDWPAAFRIVWAASFAKAAADQGPGAGAGAVAIDMENLPPWPQRRRLCLSHGRRCAEVFDDQELAGAWTMLGADPSGPGWRTSAGKETYVPVFMALADAIVADPALLDDETFAEAVDAWRFLERAGSAGEDDLIVAARRYGAMAKIDRGKILAWARRWAEARR
jgi:hypothetical protein